MIETIYLNRNIIKCTKGAENMHLESCYANEDDF